MAGKLLLIRGRGEIWVWDGGASGSQVKKDAGVGRSCVPGGVSVLQKISGVFWMGVQYLKHGGSSPGDIFSKDACFE